jgi:hypothetical protein
MTTSSLRLQPAPSGQGLQLGTSQAVLLHAAHADRPRPALCCLQLEKAQSQHARWQSLGRTNPDKKRLEADIEDECKSIAWQARRDCAASLS